MLAVGKSKIAEAGDGLFAAEHVPASTRISYEGKLCNTVTLTPEQIEIALDVGKGLSIVGSGLAAKINDGLDLYPTNTRWVVVGEGLFAKAFVEVVEDLLPGDELYISYGDSYWKHFHDRRKK